MELAQVNKNLLKGQVIKVISEQFYVLVDGVLLTCKERGILKKNKTLPLVGDYVLVDVSKKVIEEILPRKNVIIRPNVANIDQALIVTSLKTPDFSTNLLDKLLVQLEINKIKPIICLTKEDLLVDLEIEKYQNILNYYRKIGYLVISNQEKDKIKEILENKVTVFTGQTGAGKSTLLNNLFPSLNLKTDEVSLALNRGKHTTRHTEIIEVNNIKVLDTPGFSVLSFLNYQKEDVRNAFLEFKDFPCLYQDCMHIKESECLVKKSVLEGKILESRYLNYVSFIKEFTGKESRY